MPYENDKDNLIARICTAFDDVIYPEDGKIMESGSGHSELEAFLDAQWEGRSWRDISSDLVQSQSDALYFGKPVFHQWLLPAFLLHSIDDIASDKSYVMWLMYTLTCSNLADSEDAYKEDPTEENEKEYLDDLAYYTKRRSSLTLEQKKAIRAFLEFAIAYSDDEEYIELSRKAIEREYYLL